MSESQNDDLKLAASAAQDDNTVVQGFPYTMEECLQDSMNRALESLESADDIGVH